MVSTAINRRLDGDGISVSEWDKSHDHVLNALLHRARIIEYRAIGVIPQWVKEVIDDLDIG